MTMPLGIPHCDGDIRRGQIWIAQNYNVENPVAAMTEFSGLAPATFARRFRRATGYSPMDWWLFVIARTSTFPLKGRAIDVTQIGRQLGVAYILSGSVR